MEGVGGAHQEVTWQRYNGVRRSKFMAEDDIYEGALVEAPPPSDTRDRGRRFVGQKSKTEGMWTEITKDLVSEKAMKEMGYEYEETEFFYYVMTYLRYVSFLIHPYSSSRVMVDTDKLQLGGRPAPGGSLRGYQKRSP